jgi:hypothetical protein
MDKQSSVGMKVGFSGITLRQSGRACNENLQVHHKPKSTDVKIRSHDTVDYFLDCRCTDS